MATEKIGIEVEVKGAEKSISSFKDLKTAIKAAKDEQIAMTEKFGASSVEATKAGKKLADLKDKVEDLNDSTKSLKGSGVEKLTSSFRLLGEGIGTFDFDKVKTGFKGVGAAMSAIPIFLIIEGLKYLYDNFDKVVEIFNSFTGSSDNATASLKKLNAAIEDNAKYQNDMLQSNDKYTKLAILNAKKQGLSELEIQEIEKSGFEDRVRYSEEYLKTTGLNYDKILANEEANLEDLQKATKAENDARTSLDNERTALKVYNLEKEIDANAKAVEKDKALKDKANEAAKVASQKRLEDEKKLLSDIENAKEQSYIKTLKSEQTQSIAKAQFDNDKLIEDINKSSASKATKNKALAQAEITLQDNILQIQKDYKVKQEAIEKTAKEKKDAQDKADEAKRQSDADKAIAIIEDNEKKKIDLQLSNLESGYQLELEQIENNDLLKLQKEQQLLEQVYQINIENTELLGINKLDIDNKYAQDKIALEKKIAAETKKIKQDEIAKGFENIKNGLQSAQNLSDLYFTIKSAKVKKGSKEEEDLARKQFDINKKLNLAMATINGIQAIQAILATAVDPTGITTALRIAASATLSAVNIAKIATSQFESGGGAPTAEAPTSITSAPTSQAPAIYGPGQGQSTTFTGNQNNSFAPVKAYVVETENRSTTNRVNKLVSEATYG